MWAGPLIVCSSKALQALPAAMPWLCCGVDSVGVWVLNPAQIALHHSAFRSHAYHTCVMARGWGTLGAGAGSVPTAVGVVAVADVASWLQSWKACWPCRWQ